MTAGVAGASLTAQASLGGLGHIQRGLCPMNLVLPESGTSAHKPAPLSLPVSVTGSTSAMVNFWPVISLDVSPRVFLDEMNIFLGKADRPL